jgi:hypothetical protein
MMSDTSSAESAPLNARIPADVLAEIDKIAASESTRARTVTRSDIVREILIDGVKRRLDAARAA